MLWHHCDQPKYENNWLIFYLFFVPLFSNFKIFVPFLKYSYICGVQKFTANIDLGGSYFTLFDSFLWIVLFVFLGIVSSDEKQSAIYFFWKTECCLLFEKTECCLLFFLKKNSAVSYDEKQNAVSFDEKQSAVSFDEKQNAVLFDEKQNAVSLYEKQNAVFPGGKQSNFFSSSLPQYKMGL